MWNLENFHIFQNNYIKLYIFSNSGVDHICRYLHIKSIDSKSRGPQFRVRSETIGKNFNEFQERINRTIDVIEYILTNIKTKESGLLF